MTFNIEYGTAGLDTIVGTIRHAAPDIVALQEVDVHWAPRSNFVDQATTLGARLGMNVRFARIYRLASPNPSNPPREFGVALLTRLPVVRFRNDLLTRHSTQQPDAPPSPMPGLLDATLDVHGTPLRVLNTHLDYRADGAVRATQVAELLSRLDDGPTLVFGDMNAPPEAPELRPLFTRLRDAWTVAGVGAGFTFPATDPVRRIDYVLGSPQLRVRGAAVVDARASDHRPVVVDLVLARR